jgi:hypothetical protein
MKKHVDVLAVILFLIALASVVAVAKGHGNGLYGFSSGV